MKAKEARRILRERDSLASRRREAQGRLSEAEAAADGAACSSTAARIALSNVIDQIERLRVDAERLRSEIDEAEARLGRDDAEIRESARSLDSLDSRLSDPRFAAAEERLRVVARAEEERKRAEALSPENVEGLKWLHRVFSASLRASVSKEE